MAPRSKLKVALAAEKGLTDKKLKQIKEKKKHKAVIKDKRSKGLIPDKKQPVQEEDSEDEEDDDYEDVDDDDDDESDDDAEGLLDVEAEETDGDESDGEGEEGAMTAAAMMNESDTDSESEVDMEEKIVRPKNPKSILKKGETQPKKAVEEKKKKKEKDDAEGAEDQQDDDEESDIALSDLEDLNEEDREDLYVKTRLAINNQPALLAAVRRISIPKDKSVPFATHQTVVSSEPTGPKIEDISDDLNRELQLYAQSLEAAKRARALLRAEGGPFSRPRDYFAEMVKDDGHMQRVKDKLVEDATAKKASAEARKLRDLKKFGKQVQVAKLQERQKEKKDTLEKIKELKKKRSENGGELGTTEADLFDVAVDSELNGRAGGGKRPRGAGDDQGGRGGPNNKRAKKDAKFGFGGKKRHGKSGDAASSADLTGFSAKRMKKGPGGPGGRGGGAGGAGGGAARGGKSSFKTARPGKDKRKAAAGRR